MNCFTAFAILAVVGSALLVGFTYAMFQVPQLWAVVPAFLGAFGLVYATAWALDTASACIKEWKSRGK